MAVPKTTQLPVGMCTRDPAGNKSSHLARSSPRLPTARRFTATPNSAAALTCPAFGANAARAGADYFVAAADRTGDPHEDAAKRHHYAFRAAVAVSGPPRSGGMVRRILRDHVEQFFFAGALQIGYRPVQSFFIDLGNLLQRQLLLSAIRRCRLLVAFDELAREPAENVIGNAGRMTNIRIFCEPARFESLIGEFFHQALQWHAVLQRNRSERTNRIHQPADRASLFRHGDEKLAWLTVLIQTDCDVAFVPGNFEPVRQGRSSIWHTMPDWLIELAAQRFQCLFQFANPVLKFLMPGGNIESAHVFCLARVQRGRSL